MAAPPTQYEPEKWYIERLREDAENDIKQTLEKIK